MKKNIFILILSLVLGNTINVSAQSVSHNYVLSRTMQSEDETQYLEQIEYYDGLGRPVQTNMRGITPTGKDLISYYEYDLAGRDSCRWLPAVHEADGNFTAFADIVPNAKITNGDNSPYSITQYEASMLDRVYKEYGPGARWHNNNKAVKTEYQVADGYGVIKFEVTGSLGNPQLKRIGNYQSSDLYVTKTTDESGYESYQYVNKIGQTILERRINYGTPHNTYYVYDDFGNLTFVLPPEASKALSASATSVSLWPENHAVLKKYVYRYRYDDRNRCIGKRLPGTDWVFYYYDKADHLVFSQDGEQRAQNEYTFFLYDGLDRMVMSGTFKNTLGIQITNARLQEKYIVAKMKQNINAGSGLFESYDIYIDGALYNAGNYNSLVLLSKLRLLTVNYYDNYSFRGMNYFLPLEYDSADEEYHARYGDDADVVAARGMLTGTATGLLDGSDNMLYSIIYYDNLGRVIQTQATNHLGGYEKEYTAYNFTGQPLRKKHIHSAPGKASQTELYTYTYDHAGRTTECRHKLNNRDEMLLAENTYDELGRLVHTQPNEQFMLENVYSYNVRSWLTNLYTKDFSADYTYDYNGNINRMDWLTNGPQHRTYTFSYDQLSRLKGAAFRIEDIADDRYRTAYTYDMNGNIRTLKRYGKTDASNYGIVDQLTAEYNGNQLKNITDAAPAVSYHQSGDFKDYSSAATEYSYNANGAMIRDLNKGISSIQYNSLNLPEQLDIISPVAEARNTYLYSASGRKLRTVQQWNPDYAAMPVIGTDVNVSSLTMTKTTDYAGNIIYENGQLKRILTDNGYIENGTYYFHKKDHLGNVRWVGDEEGSTVQYTDYYPFGLPFADAINADEQPYKYNSKEYDRMHGLNLYDYSARYYDPAFPIFITQDPLAEKYPWQTPYSYAVNNPLRYEDTKGLSPKDKVKGAVAAVVDNATGGLIDLRGTFSYEDAGDYNIGQNLGDGLSIAAGFVGSSSGGSMIEGGVAVAAVSVAAAPATGGASLVVTSVSGATVITGTALVAHGTMMIASGADNLKNQKGRVDEQQKTEKAANYERVSDKQIKEMKKNGFEPHDNKPKQGGKGGKIDYYKNKDGDLFYKTQNGNHYESIYENINDFLN